ncbi:fibronectin type III domain-containing protein [Flavobacterium sp. N502540]|uniref:fibronectin type III domain-containing protein n=1 Tax=Flavobacterium sp. N502540 TaxID=2986838 RepID=UPI0022242121|nr:fibronectin type III domain-containing protein [Flavobacterium sp. N502540]
MKQINFSHPGGFPLEQETLERIQSAYRSELFGALKAHFSIETCKNYMIMPATAEKNGWAIIHLGKKACTDPEYNKETPEGILYPIKKGEPTGYLKTIRKDTNLIYGTGKSQTAYFDYEAVYIEQAEYTTGASQTDKTLAANYHILASFKKILDHAALEAILAGLNKAIEANTKAIETNAENIEKNTENIGKNADAITKIKEDYLPIDGSKAMTGNLTVEGKVYLKQTGKENPDGSILVLDSSNQVIKSNTLISRLLERVTELEKKKPVESAIPKGMIAIWGRPAAEIPEGWQEYAPLRGRMPVGFDLTQSEFNEIEKQRGAKNKTLTIDEMPSHRHKVGPYAGVVSPGDSDWIAEPYEDDVRRAGNYSAPEGGGQQFSILNPYSVVHFIEYTGLPNNTTKPAPPTNLIVTKATSSSISLGWTKATGNVTDYLLSIDGGDFISLGNVDKHTVTNLTPERPYTFTIFTKDTAGNISDGSAITKVTPKVLPVPESLRAVCPKNEVTINWNPVNSNTPITYLIIRTITQFPDREPVKIYVENSTTATDSYSHSGTGMNTHVYTIQALGEDGNESKFSYPVEVAVFPWDHECFDVESLVTMASGQSKKLKNIVIGDKLQGFSFPNEIDESEGDYMTWNGKLTEAAKAEVTVTDKKTSIQPNFYEIKTQETTIKVTGEHPLLVTEDGENLKWTRAKNVQQTMLLIDRLGKTKPIESIVFREEPLEVALLDVENVDNYVISGIVAHNTKVNPEI